MNVIFRSSILAKSEKRLLFAKEMPQKGINHTNMLMLAKFLRFDIFVEWMNATYYFNYSIEFKSIMKSSFVLCLILRMQ